MTNIGQAGSLARYRLANISSQRPLSYREMYCKQIGKGNHIFSRRSFDSTRVFAALGAVRPQYTSPENTFGSKQFGALRAAHTSPDYALGKKK